MGIFQKLSKGLGFGFGKKPTRQPIATATEIRIATPGYAATRLVIDDPDGRRFAANIKEAREGLIGQHQHQHHQSSTLTPSVIITGEASTPRGMTTLTTSQSSLSFSSLHLSASSPTLSLSSSPTALFLQQSPRPHHQQHQADFVRQSLLESSIFYCPQLASVTDLLEAPFDYERLVGTPRGIREENNDMLPAWIEYFAQHGRGSWMRRTPALRELVHAGIPCCLRGEMWMILSGAVHLRSVQPKLYTDICRKMSGSKGPSIKRTIKPLIEQIDKDLLRVFGGHAIISSDLSSSTSSSSYVPWENPSCLGAIRRVLVAHVYRNRAVGYTQGMHELVGLLLVFLDESDAFLLLCTICETLLPYHYSNTSYGCLAEIDLLREYVGRLFPTVVAHVSSPDYAEDQLGMKILDCFLLKWVFSLFSHGANCVTFEVVLRIWDLLFFENKENTVIVRCCLGLLDLLQEQILATPSEEELSHVFQSTPIDPDLLIASAAKFEGHINHFEAKELRYYFQTSRVRDITVGLMDQAPLVSADLLLPGSASLLEGSSQLKKSADCGTTKVIHARNHHYHTALPCELQSEKQVAPGEEEKLQPFQLIDTVQAGQSSKNKHIDFLFAVRTPRETFHLDTSLGDNMELAVDLPDA